MKPRKTAFVDAAGRIIWMPFAALELCLIVWRFIVSERSGGFNTQRLDKRCEAGHGVFENVDAPLSDQQHLVLLLKVVLQQAQ
jgi:hypothetical protein